MKTNHQLPRLVKALLRQPVDRTPVWLMRQAGRYLPEYRAIRQQVDGFMGLCQNPELAAEVTLQPLARFDLDAAIVFSDILTVADALGLGLYFSQGEGPKFERPISSRSDIDKLAPIDPSQELRYVMDTVALARKNLADDLPLIGFAGSPWTVATYMVEGGSSKDFSKIRRWLYQDPASVHCLLAKLADVTIDYLNAQIASGADVVMLFDSWGGVLSTAGYQDFSLQYMQRIMDGLIRKINDKPIPVVLFTKQGHQWLEIIAKSGCDGIGVDWTIDLAQAKQRVGGQVALQGNLDPMALFAPPEQIKAEVKRILAAYDGAPGHVFNLGHGINQFTPPEHVAVMVDAAHGLC